jgi:hypothetical protein
MHKFFKNKYWLIIASLNTAHTIGTKIYNLKQYNIPMQGITNDIIELIIKLILVTVTIGLLKKYETIKQLLLINKTAMQYHTYRNATEGLDYIDADIKQGLKNDLDKEKKIVRQALVKYYPKLSNIDIDKLVLEYYK